MSPFTPSVRNAMRSTMPLSYANIFLFFLSCASYANGQFDSKYCSKGYGYHFPYKRPCYCDDACDTYDDCCIRFSMKQRTYSCMDISEYTRLTYEPVFVFDRCPLGTETRLKQLCESPLKNSSQIARSMIFADSRDHLFRNAFCLICNGAKFGGTFFWRLWCKAKKSDLEIQKAIRSGITLAAAVKNLQGDDFHGFIFMRNPDPVTTSLIQNCLPYHIGVFTKPTLISVY